MQLDRLCLEHGSGTVSEYPRPNRGDRNEDRTRASCAMVGPIDVVNNAIVPLPKKLLRGLGRPGIHADVEVPAPPTNVPPVKIV